MLRIDLKSVRAVLEAFIRDSLRKNGFEKAILGLSGGLDSAVVLGLCRSALGPENVLPVMMPYRLSASSSLEDARELCRQWGMESLVVEISPMVDAYFERYPYQERLQVGNKCARERMSILYDLSLTRKAMVVGTSNKSEILMGYSTLWGDMAAAFQPLGDLYKTQVFALGRELGVGEAILGKAPSADLWENQTDEGELGWTYARLDRVLFHLVEAGRSCDDAARQEGLEVDAVRDVWERIRRNHYKRTMPPVAKLQVRTVGVDFRYPRDWGR